MLAETDVFMESCQMSHDKPTPYYPANIFKKSFPIH